LSGTLASGAGAAVGVVTGIWRYPVKSTAEALNSAYLSWAGLAGDRKRAFLRPDSGKNGFPWHTIRENPAVSGYIPQLLGPGVYGSTVRPGLVRLGDLVTTAPA
jgi:hypothetical protein